MSSRMVWFVNAYFPTAMIAAECAAQLEKSKMQTMRWRGRIISFSCVHQFRPKRAHNNQIGSLLIRAH